jgi:hypothetical protein
VFGIGESPLLLRKCEELPDSGLVDVVDLDVAEAVLRLEGVVDLV